MEEYRIDLKVRNNIILQKIEEAGYKTVGEFCRLNNFKNGTLSDIIALKKSPLKKNGDFLTSILRTANALGCDPIDLFSDTQMHTVLKSNKRNIKVNEAEMRFMLENSNNNKLLENHVFEEQRNSKLEKSLDCLRDRERDVIEMRMGLGKYEREHTLKEIGDKFNLSQERIRVMEAKALRKLRHPAISNVLREYIEEI